MSTPTKIAVGISGLSGTAFFLCIFSIDAELHHFVIYGGVGLAFACTALICGAIDKIGARK